jgi:DNA polymerase I
MIYLVTNDPKVDSDQYFRRCKPADVIRYFVSKARVGFDTETTGFDSYKKRLLSAQFGDQENQFVVDCSSVDLRTLKPLFDREDLTFVIHHAKFDLSFVNALDLWPKHVHCTFLQEQINFHGIKTHLKSLEACVFRYFKVHLDKTIRGEIHKEGLSRRVIQYAAEDTTYLLPLDDVQRKIGNKRRVLASFKLANNFVRVLTYTERCGLFLNKDKWKAKMDNDLVVLQEATDTLNKAVVALNDWDFLTRQLSLFDPPKCKINWNSSQQVIELLKKLGVNTMIDDPENPGQMKDSANAKVLAMRVHEHSIIPTLLSYSGAAKVVSTYGQKWIDNINPITGRIHTSFKQTVNTGRLSSGDKDEGLPNFQNIPSDSITRGCFEAEEGNVLVGCDYSGQEQILLANFSGESKLIEFYKSGQSDMHSFVTREIAKVSPLFPKEIVPATVDEIKSLFKEFRQKAKTAGFAINYGGNGFTIAKNLGLDPKAGNAIYEAYFMAFPDLRAYFDKMQEKVLNTGVIEINKITGLKYYVPNYQKFRALREHIDHRSYWERYREQKEEFPDDPLTHKMRADVRTFSKLKSSLGRLSQNYPIQGSAADMTKIAAVLFFNWIEREQLRNIVKIVNMIHDEIVIECPENLAQTVAHELKEAMVTASLKFCPIVPMKAEPTISKCWQK